MMNELLRMEKEGTLNEIQRIWFMKTKPVEELYDTETDPFELHNLAPDPAYKEKLNELRNAHEQWERDTHDVGFTPEKEVYLSMWPDGVQPQTKNVMIEFDRKTFNVTLHCSDPGASIVYKIGQQEKTWQLYTAPFVAREKAEVITTAIRYGFKQSGESSLVLP